MKASKQFTNIILMQFAHSYNTISHSQKTFSDTHIVTTINECKRNLINLLLKQLGTLI